MSDGSNRSETGKSDTGEPSVGEGSAAAADTAAAAAPSGTPQLPVKISCSRGLAAWLVRHKVSIGFTSYQTGRLYLVGVDGKGRVSFHERYFARAMGLWGDQQRLLLSTLFQLWRFENVLGPGQKADGGSDRHYVPRVAHTTGRRLRP